MDPITTYYLMIDETEDLDTRAVAATDLLVWLANGSALPDLLAGVEREVVDLARHTIFKALDALAEFANAYPTERNTP